MMHHLWKLLLLLPTVDSFLSSQIIKGKQNDESSCSIKHNFATRAKNNRLLVPTTTTRLHESSYDTVDIAIVGAGIGGLSAGAILNTLYGKKVGVYESHYLPGGCAHAFDRKASNGETFTFDSGPTILLGYVQPFYLF